MSGWSPASPTWRVCWPSGVSTVPERTQPMLPSPASLEGRRLPMETAANQATHGGEPAMFGTILLAVDGSKPAEKAVELAARIAKAAGDEIVVVHVTERLPYREVQPPPPRAPRGGPRGDPARRAVRQGPGGWWAASPCRPSPHHVRLRGPPHPGCRQRARGRPDRDGLSWSLRSCRPAGGQRGPQSAASE